MADHAHDGVAWAVVSGEFVVSGVEWLDDKGRPVAAEPGAHVLDLGLGRYMPVAVTAGVTAPEWAFTVGITLFNRMDGAQVLDVRLMTNDTHSVSTADLRTVPVEAVVRAVQSTIIKRLADVESGVMIANAADLSDDQRLQRAAVTYRTAVLLRGNATEDVAADLGVSRATAGRMIKRCREVGLLGPAKVTTAGERVDNNQLRGGRRARRGR